MSDEIIYRYLTDLRSRSDEVRVQASLELRSYISRLSRELPPDSFSHLLSDINRTIFTLVNSSDPHDKLASISLICQLLPIASEDNETKLIRFANYLRMIFQHTGMSELDTRLLREAAHALGLLASEGGVLAADMVEFEVKRALEWLEGDRGEQRRYCAVCVLKELAEHTPTLFNIHVGVFLDRIWLVMRDSKLMVREASCEALRACLRLIAKRSWKLRQARYSLIYQEVLASVRAGGSESVHAGLMTIGELLRGTGEFMQSRYREVCDMVMRCREHKEKFIRETVITLIPLLASYNPTAFHSTYFREALAYLLTSLKNASSSREVLFIALGQLSLSMRQAILPDLDLILALCREGLTARSKKAFCVEALTCVGMVCQAVGRHPRLVAQMNDVIEQMFSAGLSKALVDALTVVSRALPSYLPSIQERLLTGLTVILTSTSLTQAKTPSSSSNRSISLPFSFPSSFTFPLFSPSPELKPMDPAASELLLLALSTLGTFEFERWEELLVFVRDVVVGYLDDERPRVRRQAALTCAEVVLKGGRGRGSSVGVEDGAVMLVSGKGEEKEEKERRAEDAASSRIVQRLVAGIEAKQAVSAVAAQSNGGSSPNIHRVSSHPALTASPVMRAQTSPALPPSSLASQKSSSHLTPSHHSTAIVPHPSPLELSLPSSSPSPYPSLITDILDRLLTVSISDPDPTIRATILSSFHSDPHFDPFLSSPSNIHSLFIILNDELFSIRELVIALIGRLAVSSPSHVMPLLRKTLIQLLTELQYTGDQRQKEESALLIGHLLTSSHLILRPYVPSILTILVTRLSDTSQPSVLTCVLQTLAHLASIGSSLLISHLPTLLPLIIPLIEDRSSLVSKEVALRALTQVILHTGHVITPYLQWKGLMRVLLNLLRVGVAWGVRREVMKLIGVLGALDPYRYKDLVGEVEGGAGGEKAQQGAARGPAAVAALEAVGRGAGAGGTGGGGVGVPVTLPHPHEDYYPTLAIASLMTILSSSTLSVHHQKVIQALMFIIKNMSTTRLVTFLPHLIPPTVAILSSSPTVPLTSSSPPTSLLSPSASSTSSPASSSSPPGPTPSTSDELSIKESLFSQTIHIVNIVKASIKPYIPSLLSLSLLYLSHYTLLDHVFLLINRLSLVMRDDWRSFLSQLLPHLLSLLSSDRSPHRALTFKTLHTFDVFGSSLSDYLHLIVPALLRLCEAPDVGGALRVSCMRTIGLIAKQMDIREYAGRLVHPLARMLDSQGGVVVKAGGGGGGGGGGGVSGVGGGTARDEVLVVLCLLVYQLQADYLIFIPMMSKILQRHNLHHERYDALIHKLLQSHPLTPHDIAPLKLTVKEDKELVLPDDADTLLDPAASAPPTPQGAGSAALPAVPAIERVSSTGMKKLQVSQSNLKKAWEVSQRSTSDDWVEWFRVFSIELLKESPSPPLRACSILAQKHHLLARELFTAAFASCWVELSDEYEDDLVRCLEIAFNSSNIPPELITQLLNLAEYMERDGQRLPIDIVKLGVMAEGVHAYAKALHYKEMEFLIAPHQSIDGLIGIHNALQQPDSAVGVLEWGKKELGVGVKEGWYEKLQRWEEALEAYDCKALEGEGQPSEVAVGRMRCLRQLGEWERLEVLAATHYRAADDESVRREIAPLAAHAAWMKGKWADLALYLSSMEEGRIETEFLHAVIAVHQADYAQARVYIERTRELLDSELSALVSESYPRAYRVLVQVQQLGELEEVIMYKTQPDRERRGMIIDMWAKRLRGCQEDVDVWSSLLSVRSMVMQPQDDVDTFLHYSSLCRKSNRLSASLRVFTQLLHTDAAALAEAQLPSALSLQHPTVVYAYLKHLWAAGLRDTAYAKLGQFVAVLSSASSSSSPSPSLSSSSPSSHSALLAKAYLKLGTWQLSLDQDSLTDANLPSILSSYLQATLHSSTYKPWHHYATFTFRIVSHTQSPTYIVPAVKAFFRSIALAGDQALQDVLRLLTLWFTYGHLPDVEAALQEGFSSITIDTWLPVIPQIIARIDTGPLSVRRSISALLCQIGRSHPQALVYPLAVVLKSQGERRETSAGQIMSDMRLHSSSLVDQALMVSKELIRVAILWHEMWHEALEEASRLWFGQKNVDGMIATLQPLHALISKGPATLREVGFLQSYGRDLAEAKEWCDRWHWTRYESDLNAAWDLYCACFRRINKQLSALAELELQYVSPMLLHAEGLDLAMPGTWMADRDSSERVSVTISRFVRRLKVIESKQRPRKLSIVGSDGKVYTFLLKGHEDLRQDKRVMQLFGLVNTMLSNDSETSQKDLRIKGYSVIPLSPESGLIQWLHDTNTLHALIKDYREQRRVLLNIEHRLMLTMAPTYPLLTLIQKVEVFEHALARTAGLDLAKILWLHSPTSEQWLERRMNYTHSLSVMSMVGYVLGLGDRHPCNLMLDSHHGKVIHVDFGDCLTGDHRVLTRSGWTTISRVKVGDEVLSFNKDSEYDDEQELDSEGRRRKTYHQEWKRVTAVVQRRLVDGCRRCGTAAQKKDQLYRMQGSGMDIIATRNHRMLLARVNQNSGGGLQVGHPIEYETVDELLPPARTYITNHNSTVTHFSHSLSRAVVRAADNHQPAVMIVIPGLERVCQWWMERDEQVGFLEFLGFWLGDGWLHVDKGSVCVDQTKEEANRWLAEELYPKVFPNCWYRMESTRIPSRFRYVVNCPPLYEYLRLMAVGPLGYNPRDEAALRAYPHYTPDEGLAAEELKSDYHTPYNINGYQSRWTEEAMLAAFGLERCHWCRSPLSEEGNEVVMCTTEGCPWGGHQRCAGLTEVPAGDWFCPACRNLTEASLPLGRSMMLDEVAVEDDDEPLVEETVDGGATVGVPCAEAVVGETGDQKENEEIGREIRAAGKVCWYYQPEPPAPAPLVVVMAQVPAPAVPVPAPPPNPGPAHPPPPHHVPPPPPVIPPPPAAPPAAPVPVLAPPGLVVQYPNRPPNTPPVSNPNNGPVPAGAFFLPWNNGGWIIINGHWFYLKRWLGNQQQVANVWSQLSRWQAIALLEGFCRADGRWSSVRYEDDIDKSAPHEPTGTWECSGSSFPLIDQLQLIGQLAGAAVDLQLHTKAGMTSRIDGRHVTLSVDHWALFFSFTRQQHFPFTTAPFAQPKPVAVDGPGFYQFSDDSLVYCIKVEGNRNFLTQRLCTKMLESGNVGVKAHSVFVGNCFEVAQVRDKFPERIPFRLTRMLILAMEVSGVEGVYKRVCETVMRVLRENKESVMAVLEAFVYDPLLGWRLIHQKNAAGAGGGGIGGGAGGGGQGGDMDPTAINPDVTVHRDPINGEVYVEGMSPPRQRDEAQMPTPTPSAARPYRPPPVVGGGGGVGGGEDGRGGEGGGGEGGEGEDVGVMNVKALSVIARVEAKLLGKDFEVVGGKDVGFGGGGVVGVGAGGGTGVGGSGVLDVRSQVERLIVEATSHVNLCQCYVGWCAFW